jgi:hypothetical protein
MDLSEVVECFLFRYGLEGMGWLANATSECRSGGDCASNKTHRDCSIGAIDGIGVRIHLSLFIIKILRLAGYRLWHWDKEIIETTSSEQQ